MTRRKIIGTTAITVALMSAWLLITIGVQLLGQPPGTVNIDRSRIGAREIFLMRNNTIVGTYGGQASAVDLGAALSDAVDAAQDGDVLLTGPGEYAVEDLTIDTEIRWLAYGTICIPIPGDSNFQSIVMVDADDVTIEGLECDGKHQDNAGVGNGFQIQNGSDRTRILNCRSVRMNGGDNFDDPDDDNLNSGRGITVAGINYDILIDGFYTEDCRYIGIRAANARRLTIRNTMIYNMGATNGATGAGQNDPRSIQIEGSIAVEIDYVHMENVYCLSDTDKGHAYIGWGTGDNTKVKHATMNNVHIVNRDNISSGVSFDIPNRMQCCKFENIHTLHVTNCSFLHGSNADSAGTVYGFSFDNAPDYSYFENVVISGGIQPAINERFEHLSFKNCHFGMEDVNIADGLIKGIPAGKVSFDRCIFDLGTTTAIAMLVNSTTVQPGDHLMVTNSRFLASRQTDVNVMNDPDFLAQPRRTVFAGNTYSNPNDGDFVLSANANIYLLLTTDWNGNLMYDASDTNMPAPGSGPNFFTGVPGVEAGQRIINEEWNGSGVQYYVYNGTNWVTGAF